ncbi:hypothetical protein MNBD_ALPHA05-1100 [hydrothermal vent metagenome]|uniref:TraB/GumN family protein n=1 Tax=hydrothermal vent metagenome TaxID=652676 RepID=A0A3B0SLI2_9ZZZZ
MLNPILRIRANMVAMAVFAISFSLYIQPAVAQPVEANEPSPSQATPAMWRVTDADSEFTLLGTFHFLPPELQWRSTAFNDAFRHADVVYFEVDAEAPGAQATTVRIMMTQGFNPQGALLSDMLEPGDVRKLQDISKSLSLRFAALNPMRPWQAFLTLSVQLIVQQGFDPGSGVDSILLPEARTLGKEVRFFETLGQQLELFTGLEPKVEKALLVLTINDWDEEVAAFDRLFTAWRTGDADFIDEVMNTSMHKKVPEVFQRLIVERNKAWATEITRVMKEGGGNGFVAVGAGHLVGGDYSVPALLAAEGFEVSRYGLDAAAPAANDNAAPDDEDIGALLKALEDG